ncbi:hypothetical protein EDB81DRAFT_907421 [Dactylonectria macrodidyma]|uniref:DUF676 domain-containing protein n=1 Tax=Dactylonectria macrodidyma TaxID=307937 RepID=A0A9P9DXN3_9HYPO|nr:hypothetical protein EDB81DRAFT_907421 [Dactylonectria macrodidyma]
MSTNSPSFFSSQGEAKTERPPSHTGSPWQLFASDGIPEDGLKSTEDAYSRRWAPHDDEYWIFLNGICVGFGVVFALVQCLIQRALLYATSDVRQCYVLVRKAFYWRGVKKVVLILHSQGGLEGGMILDWLLDEVPQDLLQYLEVYTFGCLANHFSNPCCSTALPAATTGFSALEEVASEDIHGRAISRIEHYANVYDFASRWGVLNFTKAKPEGPLENRFMGASHVTPRKGISWT